MSASAVQQRVYRMQDAGLTLDSVVELVKIYSLPGMGAYTEESLFRPEFYVVEALLLLHS